MTDETLDELRREKDKEFLKLENDLKEYDGQLILLNRTTRQDISSRGCFGPSYIDHHERRTGLIQNPYLIIDKTHYFYPIQWGLEFVVNQQLILREYIRSIEDLVELKNENIKISHVDYKGENDIHRNPCVPDMFNFHVKGIDILIGDKKVQEFILKYYNEKGQEVYSHVSNLLRNPEKIKRIKDDRIRQAKEIVIETLESLLTKETKLKSRIKFVNESAKGGGYMENGARVMVEDQDDAGIVSWKDREELESIQKKIRTTISEALKLKMHMDPSKYILESMPGKKTEIYISEYILNLNTIYQEVESKV